MSTFSMAFSKREIIWSILSGDIFEELSSDGRIEFNWDGIWEVLFF